MVKIPIRTAVFFSYLALLLEFNSALIPGTEEDNWSETSVSNKEVSLQELLTTSQETGQTTGIEDATSSPLLSTIFKVSPVYKRETTLGLRDSSIFRNPNTETTNTASSGEPLEPTLETVPDIKKTTSALTPPITSPFHVLNKINVVSSTESSLAFTDGKDGPTEVDGKEVCHIRDTLMCVEELKCHGSGEIDCSTPQDYKEDEYYYDDEKVSSTTSTITPISPNNKPSVAEEPTATNNTLKAYLNFNRRRKKIHQTTKAGRNNYNALDDETDGADAKPCILTGEVQCFPIPTYDNCRGKSICGDPKKEGTSNGLKDWEIAVISVLTILGVVLLSALIYVIYSSWKKKKVRPRPRPSVPTTNVHHIMGRNARTY